MMRTANPVLNANAFNVPPAYGQGTAMTIEGAVQKTGILLLLAAAPALYVWYLFTTMGFGIIMPMILLGAIGGFIVAIITFFKKEWAPITAPVYAVLEGLFLGAISSVFEYVYPGIVIQAVLLTFGVTACLLLAYATRAIKATQNFRLGVVAATGGIMVVYLISIVMSLFGARVPFIHDSGPIGIGFSLFVVTIAALNLVLDFDFIEQGARAGAPKYLEWYAAFGLLVTLIWLYIEILRLLAKLNSRR